MVQRPNNSNDEVATFKDKTVHTRDHLVQVRPVLPLTDDVREVLKESERSILPCFPSQAQVNNSDTTISTSRPLLLTTSFPFNPDTW